MRRQVKPFVTEFRGGTRRAKDGGGELVSEAPRNRAFDEAQRYFQPDHGHDGGEDSYEAAMRAADALFASTSPSAAQEKTQEPRIERQDAGHRAAGAQAAGRQAAAPEESPWPVRAEVASDQAEGAPPRRILQAIEPPEDDRFAALEAERAPKRRGRKPGSKNKPKVVLGDDWTSAAAAPRAISLDPTPFRPSSHAVDVALLAAETTSAEDAPLGSAAEPAVTDGDMAADGAEIPSGPTKVRNDRFIRRRDVLRPGERWKRRLPKSAW